MDITASIDLEELASACVDRPVGSLFPLTDEQRVQFSRIFQESTVLITGAAGFIAQATLPHVLGANPSYVYLLDSSENGLASLARKLAASRPPNHPTQIRMVLADITSPLLARAVGQMGRIDVVLHFAAVKHVRSEREPASALRILDVNLVGTDRLLTLMESQNDPPRVFAVSTDKAANPSGLMGASKRLMESLLWSYGGQSSSTRFANVLFSSGSITESWVDRLGRHEALSTPIDTFRYFVSPAEAGLICANAVLAPERSIAIPTTSAVKPIELTRLAERFLSHFGKQPVRISFEDWLTDPGIAAVDGFRGPEYPLVCTPRDTTGEKQQEEFLQSNEFLLSWTSDLGIVVNNEELEVRQILAQLEKWITEPNAEVSMTNIRSLIKSVVPEFEIASPGPSLDSRI